MDFKIDPRILTSHATRPVADRTANDLASLRESSRELETIFIMEMFKAMRKAIPEGGLFEKGIASDMYTEMLDMETAKAASRGKGLGLGEAMYNQMAELIEKKR
ncbi:MAG: rod-binding protein [Desulforhopalus sp.]